jgi:hypothetical protein
MPNDIRRPVRFGLRFLPHPQLAGIGTSDPDRGSLPDTYRSDLCRRNLSEENGHCQSALLKQFGLAQQKISVHCMLSVFSELNCPLFFYLLIGFIMRCKRTAASDRSA